VKRTYTCT